MTTMVHPHELVHVIERLSGVHLDDGHVGVAFLDEDRVVAAGYVDESFAVDPARLFERMGVGADSVALVGVGEDGRALAQEWVARCEDSWTGVTVRSAIAVQDGLWSDLRAEGVGGVIAPERPEVVALNEVGPLHAQEIYQRLTQLPQDMRVDVAMQKRMSAFISEAVSGQTTAQKVDFAAVLSTDLSRSVEPARDRAAVASLTQLMRDDAVSEGVTSRALADSRVANGLVRAARMSVADRVSTPVWVAASTALWVHGRDEVGPVPSNVVAAIVEPHTGHSEHARVLHNALTAAQTPDHMIGAAAAGAASMAKATTAHTTLSMSTAHVMPTTPFLGGPQ